MEDLVERLKTRAKIRKQILTRKSVQEGKPDRIAELLDEAALEIIKLREENNTFPVRFFRKLAKLLQRSRL